MSRTAEEIAKYLGARLIGDASVKISRVAGPEHASADDLIYVDSPQHQERAEKSAALCILAQPGARIAGKTILETGNPKFAFAKATAFLLAGAPSNAMSKAEVHPTAIVATSARLA